MDYIFYVFACEKKNHVADSSSMTATIMIMIHKHYR